MSSFKCRQNLVSQTVTQLNSVQSCPLLVFMVGRDSLFPQVSVAKGRETFQTDQYQATSKPITHHRNALKFLGKLFSSSSSSSIPWTGLILPGFTPTWFFCWFGGFFCLFVWGFFLCAYSPSNQDCKISLQYSTPLQQPCAYKHAHNTYDTDLHSRTSPLQCLANGASYCFLSRVGGTVLYHALP